MDEEKYYDFIDLYKDPEHKGKPEAFDLSEEGYSTSCGDSFNVYIKLDGDRIRDVSFEGNGCIISTVSISKLCGYAVGKNIEDVKKLGLDDIKKLIGIEHISTSRIGCAMVGLETIKKALAKYKI
jgi:nitrogen fixation NifU-like protein